VTALAYFGCPVTVDSLWACEFLAVMQCRFDQFSPRAMSQLLKGVVDLPGLHPGAQWVALAVARVQHSADDYTAAQMCDVLVALSRLGYAPPPDVFSSFVHHVTVRADELTPGATANLSGALMQLMPGYMVGSGDGHSEYDALQMRLRERQVRVHVRVRVRSLVFVRAHCLHSVIRWNHCSCFLPSRPSSPPTTTHPPGIRACAAPPAAIRGRQQRQ
jgi:hypothetical protein